MTLDQVRNHALALRGTSEEPHFDRTSFRVNKKIFATAKLSETAIHVFLPEEVRQQTLAMHPAFISKLLWGGKVVGLRVNLPDAKPAVVKQLLEAAWEIRATKTQRGS
jgi:hypothetical protein